MKLIFYIVIVLIVAAAAAANVLLIKRAARTTAEYELILETAEKVKSEMAYCHGRLDKTFDQLETPRSKYYARQFDTTFERCLAEYSELENEIEGIRPARALGARMKEAVWGMLGTNFSFLYTVRHCADSTLYSLGAPLEMSCYRNAYVEFGEDIKEYEDEYLDILESMVNASQYEMMFAAAAKKKEDAGGERGGRLNVGIILIDALRADALQSCGADEPVMPFLDGMAREGVVYTDAVSPSSTTITSVTSMFSGVDPYEANSMGARQWLSELSLVPAFRAAGYHTSAFSANSLITPRTEFDRGFDTFISRYWPPASVIFNDFRFHWRTRRHARPFFFYVHIVDPHDPYFAPDTVDTLAAEGRPAGFIADPNDIRAQFIKKGMDPLEHLEPGNADYLKKIYLEEAQYADRAIEQFVGLMRDYGMLDNTLLAVVADHGEEFLEHGDVKHSRQLYRELVHVPLVLWGALPAGLAPGTVVDTPHSTLELFPSLLAAAGSDPPEHAAQRAVLFSGTESAQPVITATRNGLGFVDKTTSGRELAALRKGRYKIIVDFVSGTHRLFDLDADPLERNDLSAAQPQRAQAMKDELEAIKKYSLMKNKKRNEAPSEELEEMLKSIGYLK